MHKPLRKLLAGKRFTMGSNDRHANPLSAFAWCPFRFVFFSLSNPPANFILLFFFILFATDAAQKVTRDG